MAPKQIIVTEGNFNWVCAKLKKFFGHRYMSYWHTFNCGNKKRIGKKVTYNRYNDPHNYIPEHYLTQHINMNLDNRFPGYIFLEWPHSSWTIAVGDSIIFAGNRIIHKKKWFSTDYIYHCFQIEGADKARANRSEYLSY